MRFDFSTPSRILFGAGTCREAPAAARAMGSRALLVSGLPEGGAAALGRDLESAGVSSAIFEVTGEPTVEDARAGALAARREECQLVIAIGGGSAIDCGKAIAALLSSGGDPLDYLEVIGRGAPLPLPSAPWIAIPTTSGTGAEVTRNAVLASPEHGVKASLRSPGMLARLAVVDPELTLSLPPAATASTGLDALTQLIEPYVSCRANPMTDLYCVEGIRLAAGALPRAWRNGGHLEARTGMAMASLLGGLALANAGLGAVHGFAAPIGGRFPAPHGAVCAALLPHAMRANIAALESRAPSGTALPRYGHIARLLTGRDSASALDGVEWVEELCRALEIPPLRAYGIEAGHVDALVVEAARASSMKANPLALSAEELGALLSAAL